MKKLLMIAMLMFSFSANAGFIEGMIVGSALSGGKKVVNKDEFNMQVQAIEQGLWKYHYSPPTAEATFDIPTKDQDSYLVYFKNKGYKVKQVGSTLVFDYKAQYEASVVKRVQDRKYLEETGKKVEAIKSFVGKWWWVPLALLAVVALLKELLAPSASTQFLLRLKKDVEKDLDLKLRRKNK